MKRLLSVELNNIKKFCGIIDLPPLIVQRCMMLLCKIFQALSAVFKLLFKRAIKEEQKLTDKITAKMAHS